MIKDYVNVIYNFIEYIEKLLTKDIAANTTTLQY